MSLDGLVIYSLVRELQQLQGARINKVQMPSDHDIVLQLRVSGGGARLLLSANPTYPRVHLTGEQFINPLEAPMFCMLLRKHCEGGIIESVSQPGLERIVQIQIRQRDELGDLNIKTIVVELMGRHSNIILLDPASGTILDGIHHVTPAISSYRIVMPGHKYVSPPEQHKHHPMEVDAERFAQLLTAAAKENGGSPESGAAAASWEKAIVKTFSGFSPLVAKELAYRAGLYAGEDGLSADAGSAERNASAPEAAAYPGIGTDDGRGDGVGKGTGSRLSGGMSSGSDSGADGAAAGKLWAVFHALMSQLREDKAQPNITEHSASGKAYFSITPLGHIQGTSQPFETVSRCLEAYYSDKAERDTVKQRVSDMIRLLTNERSKNVKKLEKLNETLQEAKEADRFRILGELLTASMHQIRKGDQRIEVINYYDEEQRPVEIALDPLLGPSENAQKYFKKYTKMKNSLSVVKEQMEHTEAEIVYIDSVLQQLSSAGMGDIEEIRDELVEQGYMRERGKKLKRRKAGAKPSLACYTSSEGIPIYVGKNNTQNDYLTNRLASAADTWLHTKDIPGSHVVIRSPQYGEATLNEAAQLAAFFSQARQSSQVPVDYTLIRHVRKPSGAKPGYVIYDHQKTLYITPEQELIKRLPVTVK